MEDGPVHEERPTYTVSRPPRIETMEKKKGEVGDRTSVCLSLFKWVVTIIMFSATLTSLVASKLSLISIGHHLKNGTLRSELHGGGGGEGDFDADVAFTMIVLFMLIPHVVSFLRTFSSSAFSREELWPSRKSIVWVCYIL